MEQNNSAPLLKEHSITIFGENEEELIKNTTKWLSAKGNTIKLTGKQFIGLTSNGWAVKLLYCNRVPEDIARDKEK